MSPKMLVVTRFGIGIRDPAWYEHRFTVFSAITLPSLLGQTDNGFEWAIIVDSELAGAARCRLREAVTPLGDRVHICPHNGSMSTLLELVATRDLLNEDGYLLVGRVDDDDAWARGTVEAVRRRAQQWQEKRDNAPGYGLSFSHGLVWTMYDMTESDSSHRAGDTTVRPSSVRRYTYTFHSMSGYTFARAQEALTAVTTSHARVEDLMKGRGYTVDVVSTHQPMWLYCRHKQTDSPIDRGSGPNLEYTVAELEARFSIDSAQTEKYISESSNYAYASVLRKFDARGRLTRELRDIDEAIRVAEGDDSKIERLKAKQVELRSMLSKLAESVTDRRGDDRSSS